MSIIYIIFVLALAFALSNFGLFALAMAVKCLAEAIACRKYMQRDVG